LAKHGPLGYSPTKKIERMEKMKRMKRRELACPP